MFLALQACFYDRKLAVIAYSLFPQPLHHLLVCLLDGLSFVVLDHDLIEPVLEDPDVPHQWAFFNEPQLVFFHFLKFILQAEQRVLLDFRCMLFLVENSSKKIFILHI